jgi:hypothetical protein
MSKLMFVLGIILLAVGAALALVGLVNPSQILIYGLSLESALDLIVGGVLSLGLGGVIAALSQPQSFAEVATDHVEEMVEEPEAEVAVVEPEPVAVPAAVEPQQAPSKGLRFPSFGRKVEVPAVAAAATAAVAATTEKASAGVQETLDALDQAKSELQNVFGGKPAMVEVEPEPEVIPEAESEASEVFEDETSEAAEAGEGELYVVEDKIVRGRPARVLSDGTVEAETDEGWMRFENLEHLDEYLDATEAG